MSSEGGKRKEIKWNDPSTVSTYANALIAVQQLSYGSIKVRRSPSESIDDIAIANDIACSANNDSSGCYNFLWAWEDIKMNNGDDKNDDNGMIKTSTYAKRQLRHPSIGEGVGVVGNPIFPRATMKPEVVLYQDRTNGHKYKHIRNNHKDSNPGPYT